MKKLAFRCFFLLDFVCFYKYEVAGSRDFADRVLTDKLRSDNFSEARSELSTIWRCFCVIGSSLSDLNWKNFTIKLVFQTNIVLKYLTINLTSSILNMFPRSNNFSEASSELSMVWQSFRVITTSLSDLNWKLLPLRTWFYYNLT
jgi:hypothetical protein